MKYIEKAIEVVLTWLRNNLITVVEVFEITYQGLSLILNGLARLFPGNLVIGYVHDYLKRFETIFRKTKDILLGLI